MVQKSLKIVENIIKIEKSGLFDSLWYGATYPCALADGGDPLVHFCNTGWRQGFRPNFVFDTQHYLTKNVDVAIEGINPLLHYLEYGEAENRRPSEYFDPAAYRRAQALAPEISCLAEALRAHNRVAAQLPKKFPSIGEQAARIEESELFDVNYYLANYPDVRESELDPLEHFCRFGWLEERRPNPYFETGWYRHQYLARETSVNPLLHYLEIGEARFYRPIVYFDPLWYRTAYLLPPGELALRHYLEHRRGQTHSPLELFDIAFYVKQHGAAMGLNRDPFAHYLRAGIDRDIDPGPDFDAGKYRARFMLEPKTRSKPVPGAEIHEKLKREHLHPLVHFLLSHMPGLVSQGASYRNGSRAR